MTTSGDRFPYASRRARGYRPEQVDTFLARVEAGLRGDRESAGVTSAEIRRAGFDLVRGGYSVEAVDRYLDQVEQWALDLELGADRGEAPDLVAEAEAVATSLTGASGKRFPRAGVLRRGYAVSEVDAYVERLVPALRAQAGADLALEPDAVRLTVFHGRRGGYDEVAVDEALDRVVDLLLRRESLAGSVPPASPRADRA